MKISKRKFLIGVLVIAVTVLAAFSALLGDQFALERVVPATFVLGSIVLLFASKTGALALFLGGTHFYFLLVSAAGAESFREATAFYYSLVCGSFLYRILKNRSDKKSDQRGRLLLVFIALVLWMMIEWIFRSYPAEYGLTRMSAAPFFVVAPFLAGLYFNIEEDVSELSNGILWLSLSLAAITALVLIRDGISSDVQRFSPIESWNNPISHALCLLQAPVVLLADQKPRSAAAQFLRAGVGLLCVVLAVLSGSRGPILAISVSLITYYSFFRSGGLAKKIFVVAFFVGAMSVTYSYLPTAIRARFDANKFTTYGQISNNSYLQREDTYSAAWRLFLSNPIAGVGVGNFFYQSGTGVDYPHNFVLELLCELGLVGACLFAVFLFVVVRGIFTVARRPKGFSQEKKYVFLLFVFAATESLASGNIQYSGTLWFALAAACNASLGVAQPNRAPDRVSSEIGGGIRPPRNAVRMLT